MSDQDRTRDDQNRISTNHEADAADLDDNYPAVDPAQEPGATGKRPGAGTWGMGGTGYNRGTDSGGDAGFGQGSGTSPGTYGSGGSADQ
jgi:hypothetical protein